MVSALNSTYFNLKYISLMPLENFEGRFGGLRKFLLKLFILGILISAVISVLIALKSYKPFEKIISLFETTGKNDMFSSLGENEDGIGNEIKYVIDNIEKSINTTKKQEVELKKRVEMLNAAQAAALLAQINPHFIHNTLEVINVKAIRLTNRENEVSQMVFVSATSSPTPWTASSVRCSGSTTRMSIPGSSTPSSRTR
jgi:two-component system sensor histidine kinase YesM